MFMKNSAPSHTLDVRWGKNVTNKAMVVIYEDGDV